MKGGMIVDEYIELYLKTLKEVKVAGKVVNTFKALGIPYEKFNEVEQYVAEKDLVSEVTITKDGWSIDYNAVLSVCLD